MKTYEDFKRSNKNFDFKAFYQLADATTKQDKKSVRNVLRNAFEDNNKLSADLLKDLKSIDFFKANKEIFEKRYETFYKENLILFK